MSHSTTKGSRLVRGMVAGVLGAGLVMGGVATSAYAAAPGLDDLGPHVVKTGEAPTGYSVTFRYDAPDDVQSVQIYGEWLFSKPSSIVSTTTADLRWGSDWLEGDVPAGYSGSWRTAEMTKGVDGIWEFTTPLPSGTFSYTFMHDCASINGAGCTRYIDPANPGWTSGLPATSAQTLSQIYVPEHPKYQTYDNDFQAPVPASALGTIEYQTYTSPTSTTPLGQHSVTVYLPNGYDPNRSEPYKTLYLSHGGGGNDSDWFTQGVAQYILENAIRDGDAEPMVLVATNYNGFGTGNTAPAVNAFLEDLKTNAIPFVEDNYNVSSDPANRAIVALSAGSARTLPLLYTDPGHFEYYGFWSAGGNSPFPTTEQLANIATVEGILHIGVGYQDFQNNINNLSFQRAEAIRASGAEVVEHNINGIHSWDVWRQLLDDFLRNVAFKKTEVLVSAPANVATNRPAKAEVEVTSLSDSAEAPSGKVEFYLGSPEGEYLGAAELGKDGKATLPFKVKYSGEVSIVAQYQGDEYFRPATATADTIAIN